MEELTPALTEFEARHEERFEGVQFDWLSFQRDGAAFPGSRSHRNPPRELVVTPVEGAASP